ncbi:MAG: hypothetical protein ABFD84_13370 [Candidatus Polarisedimenticolia bacterium]|nr:hypothetical protein [bacterium]
MRNGARLTVVALLSIASIALEIVWTRVFSAEFFYTFAFLVLSLAVLGLGLGALAVRLWPRALREERLPWILFGAGLAALAGPPATLALRIEFGKVFLSLAMLARFVPALLLLAAPFFLVGAALALIFKKHHAEMPRVYMADLLGAAGGAALAVAAMNLVGVPAATSLAAVPLILAGALWERRLRATHAAALALAATLACFGGGLPDVRKQIAAPVIEEHWDAVARIKIQEIALDYRNINIDNAANTPVERFDGDYSGRLAKQERGRFDAMGLVAARPRFVVGSIGAGGGAEVLEALIAGTGEVHAIEVNGTINRLMESGSLSDFSGRIYRDPRVRVVTEDARSYLRPRRGQFDLLVSSSSNSFAALSSGAFALSENYLFTTDAFEDFLRALKPDGFLVMEHQFYIPRAVGEALDALRRIGVADPARHLAVYDLPKARRKVLLLGRAPLAPRDLDVLFGPIAALKAEQTKVLFPRPADDAAPPHLLARVVTSGWESVAAEAPIDLAPCTDDRPFVAQMGLMRNLSFSKLTKVPDLEIQGFPLAKLLVLTVLGVVALTVLPALFLPYLRKGPALRAAPWLYFFAIGVGFMVVEVVLLQQFTLFVGSSAYTLATILLALLFASGVGARFAARLPDWAPFAGICGFVLLDVLAFHGFASALAGLPAWGRMVAAAAAIFPLGFFMGMPFPKAALRVGELVDWGFAVNGVASVVGSTAILLVSMQFGFRAALLVGAAFYLAALGLISFRAGWTARADGTDGARPAETPQAG